jgi:MFS family permease
MGRILLGMSLSRIAGSMLSVGLILFTLDRFGSPQLAGIVMFASIAPGILVGPIAGALLDRHGRARLIIVDQLTAAASLVLVAWLALAGSLTPPLLVLITAIAGLTAPLSSVGLRTLFPLIVPRRLWERVNAIDSNGYVVAMLVGPPAAGVLVQLIGAPQTLLAIAGLYTVSAGVIIGVPDPPSPVASTGRLLVDAWQGLRYTLTNPTLLGLGVGMTLLNVGAGIVSIVVPVILLHDLGVGEAVVGAMWAVMGITGGIAALVVGRWRTQGRERAMLVWGMAGFAIAIALLGASPTLAIVVASMALQGLMNGPMDVALFTLRQRRTDPAWLGRAFAVSMSINFAGYPVGALVGGLLLGIGTDVALGVAVTCTAASAIASWAMIPRDAPAFDDSSPAQAPSATPPA